MQGITVGILVIINLAYLLLGGLVFHMVERPNEYAAIAQMHQQSAVLKDIILQQFPCVDNKTYDELVSRFKKALNDGTLSTDDSVQWSYASSVYFASTVITTIGYGHISPDTHGGKVFCIFYAIIGIPLCLVMLAQIGVKLSGLADRMNEKMNKGVFPKVGHILRAFLLLLLGFALFVLVPAALFMVQEQWGYGDALYYCIITLTTVGFGDFVAANAEEQSYPWWYSIAITAWIFIGLSWGASVISATQSLYEVIFHPHKSEDDSETASTKDDIPLVPGSEKPQYDTIK